MEWKRKEHKVYNRKNHEQSVDKAVPFLKKAPQIHSKMGLCGCKMEIISLNLGDS